MIGVYVNDRSDQVVALPPQIKHRGRHLSHRRALSILVQSTHLLQKPLHILFSTNHLPYLGPFENVKRKDGDNKLDIHKRVFICGEEGWLRGGLP